MMASKHTKGRWQSQHDFDLAGEFTIVGNVDGEIIDGHTHHTYTTVAEVYDNDNLGEDRANARLIAAAPELLEALEDAVRFMMSFGHGDTLAVRQARAAIAKATGAA